MYRSKTDTRNFTDIEDVSPKNKKWKKTDEWKDPFTGIKVKNEN